MYNAGIELRLLVNGRPMREYSRMKENVEQPTQRVRFIEARNGTNYTVQVKNDNAYRVMVVVSVDGLDVISGRPAEDVDKGYIVDGYSKIEIKGYRVSDENSAAFVFSSKGKSYVAKGDVGSGRNCGVIGIRAFREKEQPVPEVVHHHHYHHTTKEVIINPPIYPRYPNYPYTPWTPWYGTSTTGTHAPLGDTSTSAGTTYRGTVNGGVPSATYIHADLGEYPITYTTATANGATLNASSHANNASNTFDAPISYKDFDTGTAWGKKLNDKVQREYFIKGEFITELVTYYASREALEKMGVDLENEPRIAVNPPTPQAFGRKYCQPPKGWNG